LIIKVQPEGDGQSGRARYGFSYGWENTGFKVDANPNWAGHWYESSWASGESSTVYMQISLSDIPSGAEIQQATLYLHITEVSGNGSELRHRSDSSGANGLASQQLAGDVVVAAINNVPTGWLSIDVTDYIQTDLVNGHDWAVFSLPYKNYSSLTFSSAETDNGAYLAVVIPEPATLAIFGVGSLFLLRRKK
jgi:hypothetical protein